MFDIGFWELVLLFIVGLIILGPEKLPRVANTIGRWVGQGRTVIRNLRRQINVELALKEDEEHQQEKDEKRKHDHESTVREKTTASTPPRESE